MLCVIISERLVSSLFSSGFFRHAQNGRVLTQRKTTDRVCRVHENLFPSFASISFDRSIPITEAYRAARKIDNAELFSGTLSPSSQQNQRCWNIGSRRQIFQSTLNEQMGF